MRAGDGSGSPPRWLRRLLVAVLPGDDWSREFVTEVDAEFRRARKRGGRGGVWYARQLLSPETIRFVWMMRRRRRATGRRPGEGTMGGGRGRSGLHGWGQDLRHAGRGLRRDARLAAFAAAILGLGIGGTAAMYGVADRILLRGPEHVEAPDELVRLYLHFDGGDGLEARTTPWIPYRTAEAIREGATPFRGVALYRREEVLVEVGGGVRPRSVSTVGVGYFDLLGTEPLLGRFFADAAGARAPDAAVISEELWRSAFGGDPGVVGRTLVLGDRTLTVVGVAPGGFTGPHLEPVDVWLPLEPERAGNRNWLVMGRLPGGGRTGGADAVAAVAADAIHRRTDPGRFFQWARDGTIVTAPLSSDDTGREPPEAAVSRLLLAVVGLVLVIAMGNVVNLLLTRLARRRREMAVRLALGVGRWRLARLHLLESLTLAALGGLASLPVAYAVGLLFRRVLLPEVAWPGPPLQGRVLAFALLLSLLSGAFVGLLPARRADRTDIAGSLGSGGRGGTGRSGRLHLGLAAAQVTLSAALLIGAGLFVESFRTLRVTDLGVDAGKVVAVSLRALDPGAIPSPSEEEYELYSRALEVARKDPDVESAALSLGLPFLYGFGLSVAVPGRDSVPALPGGGPWLSAVTAGYFQAVGTEILRGRDFTPAEVSDDEPVIVVSESMARLLWPAGEALGACIHVGDAASPCSRVVGVVENVHRVGYREPPSMQYYVPLAPRSDFGGMALVLRPRGRDPAVLRRIRSALGRLDPAVSYVELTPLESVLDPQVRPWRLGSWVLGTAALLALLVSVAGVYGVLSYLVERRRREIGVRMALGATRAGIGVLVLRAGVGATALGLATGTALVLGAARWLRPLLFETPVLDPVVLGTAAGVLLSAAALACVLPAARALGVQPARCLREE